MPLMKAAVARAFKAPLTIEDVPIPEPGPGEVLVKVVASAPLEAVNAVLDDLRGGRIEGRVVLTP